ncbi:MAG: L,D-transpeptidase [Chitinophagaceae bacterium]|nr:L,D-transpeptidase [Chitinophagaceae bacterium]
MKTKILTVLSFLIVLASFSFRGIENRVAKRNQRTLEPVGVVYIIIDKSDYELQVYDEEGWYATYPVVFGNKDLSDKLMEGDKKTPEGTFKIISKRPHEKWHKMFMLDYPNKDSWIKFNDRKASGKIPKSAKIGGGIAIHGTWPNDNIVVDDFTNWTQGCIALKNEDLDEIGSFVPVGTKITIRR